MADYLGPLLFLVVVFVGYGLFSRSTRYRGCSDCEDETCRDAPARATECDAKAAHSKFQN